MCSFANPIAELPTIGGEGAGAPDPRVQLVPKELAMRVHADRCGPLPTAHACLSAAIDPLALNEAVVLRISRQVTGVLGAEK